MANVRMIEVTEEDEGQRVDNFMMRHLRKAPRTLIYRIIRKGEVRVNKGRVKVSTRLKAGDMVRIPPVKVPEKVEINESDIPHSQLKRIEESILFEDKDLMVINKPSGVAVHGGGGMNWGLIEVVRVLRPLAKRLELVHRIDRDTSGCLLIAKKASILKDLHAQIRANKFDKRYLAIVMGRWPDIALNQVKKINLPLRKDHLENGGWHVFVAKKGEEGKEAVSYFRLEEHLNGCDLMSIKLKTGRTHQIRVHALAQGCALLGDDRYGNREENKRFRKMGMKRLALHAQFLGFTHPATQEWVEFEAPLYADFKQIISTLKK
ncbi:Ribosomal large subunit pseudouridine synthase C [hydrothermal vent metagenome]|uniref:Ribosomal large subunit pseudouridine synthase C n=1 Tax=hydrothermal vent metagenome TaxID=652676 RepID=A0A3B0VYW2_9ZZZZ